MRWPVVGLRLGRLELLEAAVLASAFPMYYLVRGSVHARAPEAFAHSFQVVHLERHLNLFREVQIQRWVLAHDWLLHVLNAVYVYGHLPVVVGLAVWLYFRRRDLYMLMRNAFLISGGIGLLVFTTYPVAPPRMLPELGFVDTVALLSRSSESLQPSFFANKFAAMPSLHFGWNLLVGVALWSSTRHPAGRAFAVAMPLVMLAAIVLTANHYFLDAAAGAFVAGLGLAAAAALRASGRRCSLATQASRPLRAGYCWLTGFASYFEPVGETSALTALRPEGLMGRTSP